MKKNLLLLLFICVVSFFSGCEKDTHGGRGGDREDELPEYVEGALLVLELEQEKDGFDYYVTDGDVDICILNSQETSKPLFAIVQDRASEEMFSLFFSEEGYPMIYEHNGEYILMDNFSGTKADVGFLDSEGEITVYRNAETGVNWDSGFYEYWNTPSTRAIDWGRLGELYLDNVRLIVIGVGYGVKAIPSMAGILLGDRTAYAGFASNFLDAVDEAIPDNKYIKTAKSGLEVITTAQDLLDMIECESGKIVTCASLVVSGLFDVAGDVIIRAVEKEDALELGSYVLTSGYGTIQVTLRWNNVNDIDLHVEDPNGETIYWNHPTSASGGYLDYDNRVSHGPENIFWHEARLTGNYYVYVHHYEGTQSANYSVYIKAFDRSKTVTGNIGINEKKLVAMFDKEGIYTNVTLLPPMLSKPSGEVDLEKKPLETVPHRETKTEFPDLQKVRDRIVQNGTNTN
jgi:hypothetical protein